MSKCRLDSRTIIRERVNAAKLEIRMSFGTSAVPEAIGVGEESLNSEYSFSSSPRLPSPKRRNADSGLETFEMFEVARHPRVLA